MPRAAARIDLETYLRLGAESLSHRLTVWLAQETTEKRAGPWVILTRGASVGSGSFVELEGGRLEVQHAGVAQVEHIVDAVGAAIRKQYGDDPYCRVRVQGYRAGQSADPGVDYTATLAPSAVEGGVGSVTLLLQENTQLRTQNIELHRELVLGMGHLTALSAKLAEALGTTATARAATSAAGDLGGLWQLLGLAGVVVFLPTIKRELGLPKDATLGDSLRLLRVRLEGAMRDVDPTPARELAGSDPAALPPPPHLQPELERDDRPAELVEAQGDQVAGQYSAEDVIERAQGDQTFAAELALRLSTLPPGVRAQLAAMLAT